LDEKFPFAKERETVKRRKGDFNSVLRIPANKTANIKVNKKRGGGVKREIWRSGGKEKSIQ